jgi:hypothetical protein
MKGGRQWEGCAGAALPPSTTSRRPTWQERRPIPGTAAVRALPGLAALPLPLLLPGGGGAPRARRARRPGPRATHPRTAACCSAGTWRPWSPWPQSPRCRCGRRRGRSRPPPHPPLGRGTARTRPPPRPPPAPPPSRLLQQSGAGQRGPRVSCKGQRAAGAAGCRARRSGRRRRRRRRRWLSKQPRSRQRSSGSTHCRQTQPPAPFLACCCRRGCCGGCCGGGPSRSPRPTLGGGCCCCCCCCCCCACRRCCAGRCGRVHHQVWVVHCLAQPDEQVEDVRVVVEHGAAVHKGAELRLALRGRGAVVAVVVVEVGGGWVGSWWWWGPRCCQGRWVQSGPVWRRPAASQLVAPRPQPPPPPQAPTWVYSAS